MDGRTYVPEASRRGDGVGDCRPVQVEVLEQAAEPGALLPCTYALLISEVAMERYIPVTKGTYIQYFTRS